MTYILLDESGDGSDYVRPTSDKLHGTWFSVPHLYWRDDFYISMTLPAKAMLLVALSMNDAFTLPFERVAQWYGISPSTAKRGFSELSKLGILSHSRGWRMDPKSPTGYAEVRTYQLQGPWSLQARKAATMRPPSVVAFNNVLSDLPAVAGSIQAAGE
jgi:hypothetical protein